jgi:hypothetical protein
MAENPVFHWPALRMFFGSHFAGDMRSLKPEEVEFPVVVLRRDSWPLIGTGIMEGLNAFS